MNRPQADEAVARAQRIVREHPVLAPGILDGFHLLEADAGTGKTWTISGLVVRALLERELTIDRVLVVTFTRAATAELSRRIRERIEALAALIEDRLAGEPSRVDDVFCLAYCDAIDDLEAARKRLRVALAQIDEAQVRTIHGFCHAVIDEHALSIGVEQGLKVQALGPAWIERGIAAWWRDAVQDASPSALWALRGAGLSPQALVGAVRAIDERPAARMLPESGDWRAIAEECDRLRERLAATFPREAEEFRRWVGGDAPKGATRWQARWIAPRFAGLDAFVRDRGAGPPLLPDVIRHFTTEALSGKQGTSPVPALETVALCDGLEAMRDALGALPALVAREAASYVAEHRLALKTAAGAIDHDDLLRIVHDALARDGTGGALGASLRERYPLALIDECQDTDALQWEIFRAVYLPRRDAVGLILVGDPKQAIYAFRAADVYSYLDARSAGPSRHALHENQRSVAPLIEAVNALFSRDRPFLAPEIGYSASREGAKPRGRLTEPVSGAARAPLTVVTLQAGAPATMLAKPRAQNESVRACVGEIARLLSARHVCIDDRPLEPRDIAVLVNSHAEGSRIRRALADAGIGASEISRDSVIDSRECDELIRVIAAVADPSDAALVRSAFATAIVDRPLGAPDADAAAGGAQERATADAVELLAQARKQWAELGPLAALRQLFSALGSLPRLAALRDGERRLTNLGHLFELLASTAQAREGARPALRWLAQMRDDPAALGEEVGELRLDSDEDLVRIVTVHKSKGLEYPIVFLPFAWSGRQFPGRRPRGRARRGNGGPVPLNYHLPIDSNGWETCLDFVADEASDAWAQAAQEFHAEALRNLYVALTRAEHRCYLFWGAANSAQFAAPAWLLHDLDPGQQEAWSKRSNAAPELDDERVERDLSGWVDRTHAHCPDAIVVMPSSSIADGSAPDTRDEPPVEPLAVSKLETRIPAPWVRTSFSALAAAFASGEPTAAPVSHQQPELADHEQNLGLYADPAADMAVRAEVDVADADADADADAPNAGDMASQDIRFTFPAGANAGTCLHGILEQADFDRPLPVRLVARWLARGGFGDADPIRVAAWLDAVLDTSLPDLGAGTVSLRGLDPQRLVREVEFDLRGDGVENRAVLEAIAGEHPLDLRNAAGRWSGYLRGFIDLVFEANGRYFLLDWKSNRLGTDWSSYAAPAVRAAIAEHAYALQYAIYSLALHRLLRARLPDYDHDRHFGGVYYLFIRGVAPGRFDRDGSALGVHAVRPDARLLARLDRLFGASA